jgi:hypothetical protein
MGKNNACQKGATHFLKRGYCVDDEEIPCPNARKRPGEKGPGGRGQKGPPRPPKDVTRRLGTSPGPLRHGAPTPRFRRRSAVGLPPGGDIYDTTQYVTRPGMPPPTKRTPNINLGGIADLRARREARRTSDAAMADLGAPPSPRRGSVSSQTSRRGSVDNTVNSYNIPTGARLHTRGFGFRELRAQREAGDAERVLNMPMTSPSINTDFTDQFLNLRTPSPIRSPSPMARTPSPILSRRSSTSSVESVLVNPHREKRRRNSESNKRTPAESAMESGPSSPSIRRQSVVSLNSRSDREIAADRGNNASIPSPVANLQSSEFTERSGGTLPFNPLRSQYQFHPGMLSNMNFGPTRRRSIAPNTTAAIPMDRGAPPPTSNEVYRPIGNVTNFGPAGNGGAAREQEMLNNYRMQSALDDILPTNANKKKRRNSMKMLQEENLARVPRRRTSIGGVASTQASRRTAQTSTLKKRATNSTRKTRNTNK